MRKQSTGERLFATNWQMYGAIEDCIMPELKTEYTFHDTRKWQLDFAHLPSKTAIEIDGGVWNRQKRGHTSGKGYTEDREKDNAAAESGWHVLRYTPQMIERDPLTCIKQILNIIELRFGILARSKKQS